MNKKGSSRYITLRVSIALSFTCIFINSGCIQEKSLTEQERFEYLESLNLPGFLIQGSSKYDSLFQKNKSIKFENKRFVAKPGTDEWERLLQRDSFTLYMDSITTSISWFYVNKGCRDFLCDVSHSHDTLYLRLYPIMIVDLKKERGKIIHSWTSMPCINSYHTTYQLKSAEQTFQVVKIENSTGKEMKVLNVGSVGNVQNSR